MSEIEELSKIAALHPHCAYSAFIHCFPASRTIFSTVPNISNLLIPLERTIYHIYIPALTSRCSSNNQGHCFLAFPLRIRGLGISIHNWSVMFNSELLLLFLILWSPYCSPAIAVIPKGLWTRNDL